MKKWSLSLTLILSIILPVLSVTSCHPVNEEKYFEDGISKLLATYRNATVKDVRYRLSFSIPEGKDAPIAGQAVIDFTLTSKREPLVLDFRAGRVSSIAACQWQKNRSVFYQRTHHCLREKSHEKIQSYRTGLSHRRHVA
jgi:aminopeptidase N